MFILLTGPRHVGKTTACWKALPGLRATGLKIAGFVSPPILNGEGRKTGIEMVDLTTGQRQKFARVAGPDETPTVGVYRVTEERHGLGAGGAGGGAAGQCRLVGDR